MPKHMEVAAHYGMIHSPLYSWITLETFVVVKRLVGAPMVWQDAREAALLFRDWTFLGGREKESGGHVPPVSAGEEASGPDVVESLSNLLISSQADHYLLSFDVKWDNLINELRLTGGHARAALS